jgi:hypothetical protein
MTFYRIEASTNLAEVGVFPQRGEMGIGLHVDDNKHLFNQPEFTRLLSSVYIPSFKLRGKAKTTDVLSFPIKNNWIISKKLKTIFEEEDIANVQFVPIQIYKSDTLKDYFLLRSLKSANECIDFSKTEISLMKSTFEEDKKISVINVNSFIDLIEETKYPMSIKIIRPYIVQDCNLKFFSIKHVYGTLPFFVSQEFKAVLMQNNITGIRYMELDEVL